MFSYYISPRYKLIDNSHNVFGGRQNIADKYRNVVGIYMNQLLQNRPMTIFGDGTQTRAFSYIGEVAPIIAESAQNEAAYNQVFNIGADQPYSVNELATAIAGAMGCEPNIRYVPARNEVQHAYSSHEKIRRVFGRREPVTLEDGLARMAAWVRQHGARSSKKFENIEIEKNLPSAWIE